MRMWRRFTNWFRNTNYSRKSGATVRYMFPATIGTATVLGLVALSGFSAGSYLYLKAPSQAIEVGEIFPVTIVASAATPVNAVELDLEFPEDKLEVFSVDRGQSVITIWTMEPEVTDRKISLSGGTFRRGFLGEHQIATINFRAIETGQYSIELNDVRFVAGDGEGTDVPVLDHARSELALFNFDESTTPEEIQVAIESENATDIDNDGEITLTDISAFMGAWSSKSRHFDFNGDGKMSFRDFSIILADFFLQ